jgi:hypothetical protein
MTTPNTQAFHTALATDDASAPLACAAGLAHPKFRIQGEKNSQIPNKTMDQSCQRLLWSRAP